MKTLYITSCATALIFLMFFTIMSLINAPLGGQPYTIAKLTDRKKAELKLADKLAAIAAEKNKKPVKKEVSSQKEPRYFKTVKGNSVVMSGENSALKRKDGPIEHLKAGTPPANSLELADIKNTGLPLAPDTELIEKSKYGLLPRIAHNGKRAQDVYARPQLW